MAHKAGFVNIIGKPNVGKSTLMNILVGEQLSIITYKAQTTRHRILGIVNEDDYQVVFSDTPGIVTDPAHELHEAMNSFVSTSLEDADVLIVMIEAKGKVKGIDETLEKIKKLNTTKLLLINKIDLCKQDEVQHIIQEWEEKQIFKEVIPISATEQFNIQRIWDVILESLPESPPYYPKDELTDKPERFFVSEKIREKVFIQFEKEIPYSTEVVVDAFKEEEDIIRIQAVIYVERQSQKPIIIGKGGQAIKKVGMAARKDLEKFFNKKIYLELHVKVREKWKNDPNQLKRFGYKN